MPTAAKPDDAAGVRLLWNPDNVKDVAESVGISQIGEDALRCLSQDVEYRIGQVIVEALRFMRAASRTTLTVQDLSLAMRVLDVEPLYGYESTRPLRYGEASIGPGQQLYYIEDEEVEFEKLVNAPLPKVPRDASLTAHWLAIEGVQPSIPQNPTTAEARGTQELVAKGGGGPGASNPALAALTGNDNVGFKPAVKHIISNELVLYFDKIQAAILDDNPDEEVLRLREAALESVRSDPGLHQLVPYFVSFIATQITHRIEDVTILRHMMELTTALVENPHVFLDPYVTPLCAPVLTCLLGQKLGVGDKSGAGGGGGAGTDSFASAAPTGAGSAGSTGSGGGGGVQGTDAVRDIYLLRELAASLLGLLARKFAKNSALLRPKLTRTCLKTLLEPDRPVGVLFGAVAGLSAAGGPEAVRVLLLPNLKTFDTYVLQPLQERGPALTVEFEMLVAGGILKAIRTLVPPNAVTAAAAAAGNGVNGSTSDVETAELVDFLGPIVGQRVAQLGDARLNAVVLEARNIE
ncbi:histone H4-like TAF Taf6, SAGA complex subunit [Sporothrix curviconia]|uniref:Histone H4-like TAF Taf6, SAGA complex subunit n=1 Tax=Sporothrix curviconia TaxID=1260050 RepID=A0ABP0AYM0_9PEZI